MKLTKNGRPPTTTRSDQRRHQKGARSFVAAMMRLSIRVCGSPSSDFDDAKKRFSLGCSELLKRMFSFSSFGWMNFQFLPRAHSE